MLDEHIPYCNKMPHFSEIPQIGSFRFYNPFFVYELLFGQYLLAIDLLNPYFQTSISYWNSLLHFRASRTHHQHPQPCFLVTAFPCLPSPPYLPSELLHVVPTLEDQAEDLASSWPTKHPALLQKNLLCFCWPWAREAVITLVKRRLCSQVAHFLLLVWPWASYWKFLGIAFLSYKIRIITGALFCI